MNPQFEDDISIQSLITEILTELGIGRKALARWEAFFRILYYLITLLVGIFGIINTVFAFSNTNEVVKQVFLVINLAISSGLLGDFGGRARAMKNQKQQNDIVAKRIATIRITRQIAPAAIIDMSPSGVELPRMMAAIPPTRPPPIILEELVKDPALKLRLIQLESHL